MTAQEINAQLYRPLLNGYNYDAHFPNSTCSVTSLATGNTAVAIKEMAKWAKKYVSHCESIAPVLESNTLENTVNNIQDFLYNHIQYSIDGEAQNLKSPACAWATRREGTDCKSYSIFASAILLQLGIKHYLRRIKQAVMRDAYTHVYVVIPVNQKSGKINDGYFVIDGTIKYNTELPFTQKDDIYMEPKLAINGLAAGLGCAGNTNCGCGNATNIDTGYGSYANGLGADFSLQNQITPEAIEGFYEFISILRQDGIEEELLMQAIENMRHFISIGIEPTIEQVFTLHQYQGGLGVLPIAAAAIAPASKITLAGVVKIAGIVGGLFKKGGVFSKIFGGIDCWGGTAFDAGVLETATNDVSSFFVDKTDKINKAVFSGDLDLLSIECAEFLAAIKVLHEGYQIKRHERDWNSCSVKNIEKIMQTSDLFTNTVAKSLEAWLSQYFIVTYPKSQTYTNKSFLGLGYEIYGKNTPGPNLTITQGIPKLQIKSTTHQIMGFEINETLLSQGEKKQFEPNAFLQSLTEIVAIVDHPTPPSVPGNNYGSDYDNDFGSSAGNNQPKQAGGNMGMILMGAAVLGTVVYMNTKKKK